MKEKSTALLVIDMQFGPLWDCYKKEETLSVILNLISHAKERCIPIIYTQHEEAEGLLTRGSQFWQFHSKITPNPEDLIIHKQAADSFHKTELLEELENRGITHLVVTGARTEYCVDTTCRSAIFHGFDVTLVADGHTTVEGQIPADAIIKHHNFTLNNIVNSNRRIRVLSSEQLAYSNK